MDARKLQDLRNLGNECEEAADEIDRLTRELAEAKARIAELKAQNTGLLDQHARDSKELRALCEQRDEYLVASRRLQADKRALLHGSQEQASEISRLRAGVEAKAGENDALRGFLCEYRRAAVACMNSVIQTRGCDGMDGLANANDKARALLAKPAGEWVNPLAAEVADWRKLLDPANLHVNLLQGKPAQLTRAQLTHLLGQDYTALLAEVEALRAASVIEWEPGRSYTAAELLRRAIRGLRVRKGRPVWPAVMNLCGVVSTVAHHLCRWAGRDPDTGADLKETK